VSRQKREHWLQGTDQREVERAHCVDTNRNRNKNKRTTIEMEQNQTNTQCGEMAIQAPTKLVAQLAIETLNSNAALSMTASQCNSAGMEDEMY
jgi:chromosome condensin MukBEF ATPase and DNA-binding subunit MukB